MMIDFDNGDRNGLLRRSRRVIGLATTSFELLWTPAAPILCYWPKQLPLLSVTLYDLL